MTVIYLLMVNKCRLLGEINHLQHDAPDNAGQRGRERSLYELSLLQYSTYLHTVHEGGNIH